MPLILPPRTDGTSLSLPNETKQVVVIGANGAGKTRFSAYVARECGDKAFRMSALQAIYGGLNNNPDNGTDGDNPIDELYEKESLNPSFLPGNVTNTFEKLIVLLLNEEITSLVRYKVEAATGYHKEGDGGIPRTRLDRVLDMWSRIFPNNTVLRDGGRLLFRQNDVTPYSQMRLSHGEKSVLYYLGAILYAPKRARVFVDNPAMFLHPALTASLWNALEQMRPDCTFIYTTHDLDFASTRSSATTIWIRSCNPMAETWDYDLLPPMAHVPDEIYMDIIGSRKPVLFIEGDGLHSIDARLYPLIFPEYSIKSLGSCDKVIEAVRTFNSLKTFHHLESMGIVDRDRRNEKEVQYLRERNILVPEVAEIENLLLIEDVVRAVAADCGRKPDKVFGKVKSAVIAMFNGELQHQALQHTRHRVKRTVEYCIDKRFSDIGKLEDHMASLVGEINPRGIYEDLCAQFEQMVETQNYDMVLKVYNQKSMLSGSNISALCGIEGGKDGYIRRVLSILRSKTPEAQAARAAIRQCLK